MFDEPGLRGPCPVSEKDWLLMQVASAVAKFGQAMTKEAIMYGGTVSDDDLWFSELQKRVPDLKRHELRVNSALTVNTLPCEAPWLTGGGVGMIMITDIRRGKDGKLAFQLGDELKIPYDKGTVWVNADAFYNEWPQ